MGHRVIAIGCAAFVAALTTGAISSPAATVNLTLSYTGTVAVISAPSLFQPGQVIEGTETISVSDTPSTSTPTALSYQGTGAWTATTATASESGSGIGVAQFTSANNATTVGWKTDPATLSVPHSQFFLFFQSNNGPFPLLTLEHFPKNLSEIASDLGTTIAGLTNGLIFDGGLIDYPANSSAPSFAMSFTVDRLTVSQTPIPATLPLFLSAIGGLGAFGWRGRRSFVGNGAAERN